MSKYIPGNQKHLTLNDRIYIENELAKGTSFKDIAAFLCKDPTTISKEVRAHRISDWYHKGTFYNSKNFCIHSLPLQEDQCFVEMDTVHSSRESNKTLLTLFFTQEKLFLAFLLNRCTKGAVRLIFDRLEK